MCVCACVCVRPRCRSKCNRVRAKRNTRRARETIGRKFAPGGENKRGRTNKPTNQTKKKKVVRSLRFLIAIFCIASPAASLHNTDTEKGAPGRYRGEAFLPDENSVSRGRKVFFTKSAPLTYRKVWPVGAVGESRNLSDPLCFFRDQNLPTNPGTRFYPPTD